MAVPASTPPSVRTKSPHHLTLSESPLYRAAAGKHSPYLHTTRHRVSPLCCTRHSCFHSESFFIAFSLGCLEQLGHHTVFLSRKEKYPRELCEQRDVMASCRCGERAKMPVRYTMQVSRVQLELTPKLAAHILFSLSLSNSTHVRHATGRCWKCCLQITTFTHFVSYSTKDKSKCAPLNQAAEDVGCEFGSSQCLVRAVNCEHYTDAARSGCAGLRAC